MVSTDTPPTLADRFARLFDGLGQAIDSEAAKGRIAAWMCGGRWAWLAAPVLLLMRMGTRRRQPEADAVVEQLKLLMQQFVAALREAEARRAAVGQAPEKPADAGVKRLNRGGRREARRVRAAAAAPLVAASAPAGETLLPLRFSAPSAVRSFDLGGREDAQRVRPAAGAGVSAKAPPRVPPRQRHGTGPPAVAG